MAKLKSVRVIDARLIRAVKKIKRGEFNERTLAFIAEESPGTIAGHMGGSHFIPNMLLDSIGVPVYDGLRLLLAGGEGEIEEVVGGLTGCFRMNSLYGQRGILQFARSFALLEYLFPHHDFSITIQLFELLARAAGKPVGEFNLQLSAKESTELGKFLADSGLELEL